MTVVDATTYAIVGTITLPGTAQSGIAVDQKNVVVYVPVYGCTNEVNVTNSCVSGTGGTQKGGIVEINGTTDTITGEFPIEVQRLAVDSSTGILYGASGQIFGPNPNSNSSGFLLAIDGRTGSVIANTSLGAYPLSLTVDEKTNTVYIGACKAIPLPCVGAEVLAIDGATHIVRSATPLSFDALNFNVVVDDATDTVYAMGEGGLNLTLASIDGASGSVTYLSAIGSSCAGAGGGTLAFDPASNEVYASFDSQWFLLFIDGSTGTVLNMVNATMGIQFVAYNEGNDQAYFTTEAQNGDWGYLMVLPGTLSQSFVNSTLLPRGICLP